MTNTTRIQVIESEIAALMPEFETLEAELAAETEHARQVALSVRLSRLEYSIRWKMYALTLDV